METDVPTFTRADRTPASEVDDGCGSCYLLGR